MRRTNEEFGRRVREVLEAHPVAGKAMTYRGADRRTGVNYGTIGNMVMGQIPEMESVVKFAAGFGLDVAEWLRLAGYDPPFDPDRAFMHGIRQMVTRGYVITLSTEDAPLSWGTPAEVEAALATVRARAGCTCAEGGG